MHDEWNYHDEDPVRGPREWARHFTGAANAQSPIDIQVDYCDLQQHQQRVKCACHRLLDQQPTACSGGAALQQLSIGARRHLNSSGGDDFDEELRRSSSPSSRSNSGSSSTSPSSVHSLTGSPPARAHAETKQQVTTQKTRYCATNKKLFLGYPRYLNSVNLRNTGHAWQIDIPTELVQHTLLCGPPLGEREYRLAQLHCHWGSQCDQGSEHLINGRAYSAELHFVHWNCTDFGSFEEAARHKHGLCVLAVFVQALEGDEHNCNKHLEKIVAALPKVSEKPHSSVRLQEIRLDLKKLFPANRWLYASYQGSLTTPPLSEVVDWIVFLQPIQSSRRQLEAFRQLKCSSSGERLEKNCRPVQPINERVVSIWTHSGH